MHLPQNLKKSFLVHLIVGSCYQGKGLLPLRFFYISQPSITSTEMMTNIGLVYTWGHLARQVM